MSRHERRAMIDRGHHELSVVRQCKLLDISRSSAYYSPVQADEYELELMGLVDKQYLLTPFYGSRKMAVWLRGQGHQVNRKRVQRLMRRMGIEAIYRRPRTTMPDSGHKVYPYLLRGLEIDRVNQVWAADITYIPMVHGFMYLVCVMDWRFLSKGLGPLQSSSLAACWCKLNPLLSNAFSRSGYAIPNNFLKTPRASSNQGV